MGATSSEDREYPTLHQLEVFAEVVRQQSYSRAARSLGLTPSLVWRTVARLQEKVGLKLFDGGDGFPLRPTVAGTSLRDPATKVLEAAGDFLAACARAKKGAGVAELRLGCAPAHLRAGVNDAINTFRRSRPVKVALANVKGDLTGGGEDLFGALLRSEVDLIIAPERDVDEERFYEQKLYRWWLVALPPEGVKTRKQPFPIRELEGKPLLVRPRGFRSRELLDRRCRAAGFEPLIDQAIADTETLLEIWKGGESTLVVPHDVLPEDIAAAVRPIESRDHNVVLGSWYRIYARRKDVETLLELRELIDEIVRATKKPSSPAAARLERITQRYELSAEFL